MGLLPGIDGIGYLIGRGTITPGRLVLKGYERILIERKFAAARVIFPHTDDEDIEGLEAAYDELLNLTR